MKKCIIFLLIHVTFSSNAQTQFFSSFDSINIAYTDEGKGKPIVLIHGFINSGSSWDQTVLKKELLKEGYRVIIPDLRGNGSSEKPHNEKFYQNDAEVKDIIALADHLKLKKYEVVGYSRGSIITAKLLTYDARIKKGVLGGMGIDFTNPNWDRRILFAHAFSEGAILTDETSGAVAYAKSIKADLRVLHLSQVYQPVTSKEELSALKAKILIIAGDKDQDNGSPKELQKAIPNSKLQIIEGVHNDTYKLASFSNKIVLFLR
tara:strand:+ start:35178 stop:35963 length:786 start_codon:yes stop_codon:yes gene_type:complete